MKKLSQLITIVILFIGYNSDAQNVTVTDNNSYTPEESAMLDVSSSDKGFLVPRLATADRISISSPATGLLVFDTDINAFFYYAGATDGWLNLSSQIISPALAAENDPLFSVVNDNNDTVFAVYPEGVYIWVGDGNGKGNRGGFAVGGLSSGEKLPGSNFLHVSADSVRVYVDTVTSTKGNRGGFAVGGLSSTGKSIGVNYLTVSDDSVRVYVDTTSLDKGNRGGFAVGGLSSNGKGVPKSFMNLRPKNYFIGHESGKNTTGLFNSFFGFQSGYSNTTGKNNFFAGYKSGYSNETGTNNIFIGNGAGYDNIGGTDPDGSYNIFIGFKSGYENEDAHHNVFIGYETGYNTGINSVFGGSYNTFTGFQSGKTNTQGQHNAFYGYQSGFSNTTGDYNTFLGYQAGYSNTTSDANVFIGHSAGLNSNASGGANIFVGYQAGKNNSEIQNTYVGYNAGFQLNAGTGNSFFGYYSGGQQTAGDYNAFYGYESGLYNDTGNENVAIGYKAGEGTYGDSYYTNTFVGAKSALDIQDGNNNAALGYTAMQNTTTGDGNTAIGTQALNNNTTGNYNTAVGYQAGYSGASYTNATALGYGAAFTGSNAVSIGNTSVSSIKGQVSFTTYSDARFKTNVNENVKGLDFIMKLRPVSYKYDIVKLDNSLGIPEELQNNKTYTKSRKNAEKMIHTGFIAQEVELVAKELGFDFSGVDAPGDENDHYGLRYATFVVPLVKAVQEQQQMIKEMKAKDLENEARIQELEKQLETLMK